MLRPYSKCAGAGGSAEKAVHKPQLALPTGGRTDSGRHLLMASIPNHEANVVLLDEVDSGYHVCTRRYVDDITDIITDQAGLRLGSERVAALVCKICLHD